MATSTVQTVADRIRGGTANDRMARLRDLPAIAIRRVDEAALLRVLTDPDFIEAKIDANLAEELLDNLQSAYLALKERSESSARVFLARHLDLLAQGERTPGMLFTLDYLDSRMSYRYSRQFYTDLLVEAATGMWQPSSDTDAHTFVRKCQGFFANLSRRRGDLAAARQYLPGIIEHLAAVGNLKSLATFEYEMATTFLRLGDLRRAIDLFQRSAQHAKDAADEIGEWISRCLEFRVRFLDDRKTAEDFQAVLGEAQKVFNRIAQVSALDSRAHNRAESWLMSVNLHLFEIAFSKADIAVADAVIHELRRDRWLKSNNRDVLLLMCEARLAILKGQWREAIAWFARYLDMDLPGWGERNASFVIWALERHEIAEDYLFLGNSFAAMNEEENAQKSWRRGLECPDENGNGMIKPRIRSCLRSTG